MNFMVYSVNHKYLGLYYLLTAIFCGLSGVIFSILIRSELFCSGTRLIAIEAISLYNNIFSLHAIILIFFVIMPALFGGFGNYFIPLYLGISEIGFPRVNNYGLMLILSSYFILFLSFSIEFGGGTGWTLYPPLSSTNTFISGLIVTIILLSLLISGISSLLSSVNFLVTFLIFRITGVNLNILNIFVFSIILTAFLLLVSLPVLTVCIVLLYFDINYNTIYFDSVFTGDSILFQHLFWFFGHPEVYILILPAFGICSCCIIIVSCKMIFGNSSMILALSCICILGCLVWGHHMYFSGLEIDTRSYFTAVTILISLPTGTKVFNWTSTYVGCVLPLQDNGTMFLLTFLITFTLGGTTGVLLGNAGVDLALHDTYYVVAHFHLVLSLGAIISILCGLQIFSSQLVGFNLLNSSSSLSSKFNFGILLFGITFTFVPIHFLGFHSMPRRIPDFPDTFITWNLISTLASTLTFISLTIPP